MNDRETEGTSVRWLPKHGEPRLLIDFFSQWIIKIAAFLPIYTAIIVTITLLLAIFGFPLLGR